MKHDILILMASVLLNVYTPEIVIVTACKVLIQLPNE